MPKAPAEKPPEPTYVALTGIEFPHGGETVRFEIGEVVTGLPSSEMKLLASQGILGVK